MSDVVSLPPDDPAAWTSQLQTWGLSARHSWVVSGVAPKRRDGHKVWLEGADQHARLLDSHKQLPLQVKVDAPQQVGIDRLLNAVAVNSRRPPEQPAISALPSRLKRTAMTYPKGTGTVGLPVTASRSWMTLAFT